MRHVSLRWLCPAGAVGMVCLLGLVVRMPWLPDGRRADAVAPSPQSRISVSSIQSSSRYQEAVARYGRGDFAAALQIVRALRNTPDLSPADQEFLIRQQTLCQNALTPHSNPNAPPKSSLLASATPVQPVSVSDTSTASTKMRPSRAADCGPRALLLVCRQLRVPADLATLRQAAGTGAKGTSLAGLARAAKAVGLRAKGVQVDRDALANLSPPAIAWVDGNHFVAVLAIKGETATIHDPNHSRKEKMELPALLLRSGGVLLTLAR